ncbi:MAG: DUF3291 domain-containing protein [Gammaproteobacteria bacterium]|nr:DUF3291 domain-containing protein [Gammaproteobacteria bacterium]NNF60324.1 DUF3291 domain-containing protein [Gammaproteobacteria bacterium]NNM20632.1 DUF3291 domain-containing protein [Gammaproteobacteria bacterium]
MPDRQLAQVNIGRMRAPLEDPLMHGFSSRLDEINALADRSPGFIWRLQTDDGDATALRVFNDPLVLINLSVWRDVDSLRSFVYRSDHRQLLQGRRDWFLPSSGPHLALWWLDAGHRPDADEAKERLEKLASAGPSAEAFTFGTLPAG